MNQALPDQEEADTVRWTSQIPHPTRSQVLPVSDQTQASQITFHERARSEKCTVDKLTEYCMFAKNPKFIHGRNGTPQESTSVPVKRH